MLLAMGFDLRDVLLAVERTSSVEAAVEFIMSGGKPAPPRVAAKPSPNATPFLGAWVVDNMPGTFDITAEGDVVTISNPQIAWCPCGGDVAGNVIALNKPSSAKGIMLTLTNGELHASNGPILKRKHIGGTDLVAAATESHGLVPRLMELGFSEADAKEAAKRCSTVEAAVEMLSARGVPTAASAAGAPESGVASTGETAGDAYSVAAALAESAARKFQSWLPFGLASPAPQNPALSSDALVETLRNLGFSETQAVNASKRCSSLEAAVEWIASHPDAA